MKSKADCKESILNAFSTDHTFTRNTHPSGKKRRKKKSDSYHQNVLG